MFRTQTNLRSVALFAGLAAAALSARSAPAADIILSPGQSIQNAINGAGAFDRIILRPGTYTEFVSLNATGKSLIILSQASRQAILQPPPGSRIFQVTSNGAPLQFEGIVFRGAQLTASGGLTAGGAGVIFETDVQFRDCSFENNSIVKDTNGPGAIGGGAISARVTSLHFSDCDFSGNLLRSKSGHGHSGERLSRGGALFISEASLTLERCVFDGNISRVEFATNTVDGFAEGGAVWVSDSSTWIVASTFRNNSVRTVGPSTGAKMAEGGAVFHERGALFAASSLLVDNSADGDTHGVGGAMCVDVAGSTFIVNCTMTENTASHSGAAILSRSDSVRLGNSIVYGNLVMDAPSNLSGGFISTGLNFRGSSPSAMFTWEGPSDIVNNTAPGFLNAAAGDYRLAPGSICIDKAHAILAIDAAILSDLAGKPRAQDDPATANGTYAVQTVVGPAAVDIGAYEFQPALGACPSDTNGDGQVNAHDLARLLADWGACP